MKLFRRTRCVAIAAGFVFIAACCVGWAAEPTTVPAAGEAASPSKKEGAVPTAAKPDYMTLTVKVPIGSPLFADVPLATVNDDKITMDDFIKNLGEVHKEATEQAAGKQSMADLLDRLINIKLIVQEARNIGLDQVPEIKEATLSEYNNQLKMQLIALYLDGVKASEKDVQATYRELGRQVKLTQMQFNTEADAKKFAAAMRAGKDFNKLAEKAVKDGVAEKSQTDNYVMLSGMDAAYAKPIGAMKVGSVSKVIPTASKFIVLRLDDRRVVDDPSKMADAREVALRNAKLQVMQKHKAELYKKYLKQNTKLIKSLDLDAKTPGLAKLAQDKRPLVYVAGEAPITVADLVAALRAEFTHGIERAAQQKRVNILKEEALDKLMFRFVMRKEGLERGVDKTPAFKAKMADYEERVLFGAFIEKIVKPDVKATKDDFQRYYDAHRSEYTFPEMVKLKSVIFSKKETAEQSLAKLRQGMDLKWLVSGSTDLVDPDSPGVTPLDDQLVTVTSLPEGVQKALAGAKEDDYRLYEAPGNYFYVLHVEQLVPARQQTLQEAGGQITPAIYQQKAMEVMQDWSKKLRKAANVKVFAEF